MSLLRNKSLIIKAILPVLVLIACALVLLFPALQSQATMYLDKVDLIPDIKQTESRFAFPEKGKDYCAPVVVLDSLVYLRENAGYDHILGKNTKDPETCEVFACRKLAELMGTRNGPGTPTQEFLIGVREYISKFTPYKILSLKYRGWNRHSREFDDGNAIPSLSFLKNGISACRSCWINIGWYKYDSGSHELKRVSGHWVTLVGYGVGLDGIADSNTLIVRDPDPVLSVEPRKIFLTVEPLAEGKLSGPHDGLPRSARNYLWIKSMGNGIDSSRQRLGIIDGAIVLDLLPPWLSFGN